MSEFESLLDTYVLRIGPIWNTENPERAALIAHHERALAEGDARIAHLQDSLNLRDEQIAELEAYLRPDEVLYANHSLWGKSGGMLEWIGEINDGGPVKTLLFTDHDHPDHVYRIKVCTAPTWSSAVREAALAALNDPAKSSAENG